MTRAAVLATIVISAYVACSESDKSSPDTGPVVQREASVDRRPLYPDVGVPAVCDPACLAKSPKLCVKEPQTGECRECTTDEHCQKNPMAEGGKCEPNHFSCVCMSDAECANSLQGRKCNAAAGSIGYCICSSDADCGPAAPMCQQLPWLSEKRCGRPCAVDSDCAAAGMKYCDAPSRICRVCKTNADCSNLEGGPTCDPSTGTCGPCSTSAGCSHSPLGSVCPGLGQSCKCASDADCKGAYHWGGTCNLTRSICNCATNADCAGNAHGPVCTNTGEHKICTCTSDAECTHAPYTKCLPRSSPVRWCREPCLSDLYCAGGMKCSNGECIQE